jgi:hypothetical protein
METATNHTTRFTPFIGKAPLQIGRIVPWRDSLILWTHLESLPMDGLRVNMHYRQFLVDSQGNVTPLELHRGFEPWLADSQRDVLYSLEVRDRVMGGQPNEYDLPPQRVRIASLRKPLQAAVYFPVRYLDKLFLHPSGDLVVLRWDRPIRQPYSTVAYKLFLDRRTPSSYGLVWSTELVSDAGLQLYGPGPKLTVSYTPDTDIVGISYTRNDGRIEHLTTNIDAGSGNILSTQVTARVHPGRQAANCHR